MKVLIVDDEPVALTLLERSLRALGRYEVVTATTGQEAWEAFDREPFRIVISDWMMPDMDGLELVKRIRSRPKTPYTYFIVLTSKDASGENYEQAINSGVDDFLTKPLDRTTIGMRLRVADRILSVTTELRQLKDLIPICAYCRKIRNDENYWQMVETYIHDQTGSNFSHGICPDCLPKLLAEISSD